MRGAATEFHLHQYTVSLIVKESCVAIWKALNRIYLPRPNTDRWLEIARGFEEKHHFPFTLGALDGKHFACEVSFTGPHFL